jgi:ABC-2 type transport system ATP-binding protein
VAEVLAQARREGPKRTTLRLQVAATDIGKATGVLKSVPAVVGVSNGGVERQLEVDLAEPAGSAGTEDHEATNRVLEALVDADVPVLSFEVEGSRLQDAFLQLTEGERK